VFLGNVLVMLGGVGLTLAAGLWWVVAGVAAVTAGFFGAHSVASAWVGAAARDDRAQASALYLLAYYAGSSVVGTVSGFLWAGMGWTGVAGLVGGMLVAAVGWGVGLPGR
jgi:YNFM family putative membrane transporter